jgi:predicted secreted hydrolase
VKSPEDMLLPFTKIKAIAGFVLLLLFFSCASGLKLLNYERQPGSSAGEEWGIHKAGTEWWYLSGMLTDEEGHGYFFQYTLFHGVRLTMRGYSIHIALTDLDAEKHYFEEIKNIPSGKCTIQEHNILCPNTSLRLFDDSITLLVQNDSIGFDLSMKILREPHWHGDNGVITMGDTTDRKQDSYYYSFPELAVTGQLTLPDAGIQGEMISVNVVGDAWLDKQWGNFNATPWFWSSIRFNDGDRAMLFYFPENGHKEGTLFAKDGKVIPFTGFDVDPVDSGQQNFDKWDVFFSDKQVEYTIKPYLNIPFQSSLLGITYWEGLCRLFDDKGNDAGWCVVEITR